MPHSFDIMLSLTEDFAENHMKPINQSPLEATSMIFILRSSFTPKYWVCVCVLQFYVLGFGTSWHRFGRYSAVLWPKLKNVDHDGPKNECVQNHELYHFYFDLWLDFVNKLQNTEFLFSGSADISQQSRNNVTLSFDWLRWMNSEPHDIDLKYLVRLCEQSSKSWPWWSQNECIQNNELYNFHFHM